MGNTNRGEILHRPDLVGQARKTEYPCGCARDGSYYCTGDHLRAALDTGQYTRTLFRRYGIAGY